MRFVYYFIALSLSFSQAKSIQSFTKGMEKKSGFYHFYLDKKTDKIYLLVDKLEKEFLYLNSLPAGLGSNDIGLDRGQMGDRRIVLFKRFGQKIMMLQPNYDYRAISENEEERKSVEEAFAKSIIWGFKIVAQTRGQYLIDLSDFLLRDAHGISQHLKRQNQGNFSVDKSRSALFLERSKNFPKNSEFEAILSFKGEAKGAALKSVLPAFNAFTVRMHHSFIELPDKHYKARVFDPRAPYFGVSYQDYATSIYQDLTKRFIARHRLEKKNPNLKMSEAVKPIIYYVDAAAPEPVRSALIEGASWWNAAFEHIGFKNAFQVKVLPKGVDPMDVRYNVVQWVHRSTRGWSYGDAILDPRTGEIIKGHVSLGSLRIRQDFLIAEGLLAPYEKGKAVSKEMEKMALARLRQLAAHELGHTLGLAHNFAASVKNRASVMDYPHPRIKLKNNKLDLTDAYDVGIGAWDKISIAYGYSEFQKNEENELQKILSDYEKRGFQFITDADARSYGSLHPQAHLWDNGENAAMELDRVLKIRRFALDHFSEKVIPFNRALADMENALVPIYFFHRYQVEAAVKLLAGMRYKYAIRSQDNYENKIVNAKTQKDALKFLLKSLSARNLALPEKILRKIPPKPYRYQRNREQFKLKTGFNLDPISLAETDANKTISLILNVERVNRLVEFHVRNRSNPSLSFVIDELIAKTWKNSSKNAYFAEIQKGINYSLLQNLMRLHQNENASVQAKSIVHQKIVELKKDLKSEVDDTSDSSMRAFLSYSIEQIEHFFKAPKNYRFNKELPQAPGSPIGTTIQCLHF